MIEQILEQIHFDQWKWLLPYMFVLSIVVFFGSIIFVSVLLVRLPVDYLNRDESFRSRHSNWYPGYYLVTAVRTAVGLVLVLMGIVMLLTPGQGILTIIIGLTLIDFPGKWFLIRKLLSRPGVLKAINKLREKAVPQT